MAQKNNIVDPPHLDFAHDPEVIREFLIETEENLARLDNEIVELEQRPHDAGLLASIFRTVHTVKGTCGFLGFSKLEAIAHEGETILCQVRAGRRGATLGLITLLLEAMDATRKITACVERAACGPAVSDSTIRVDVGLLDRLMNLVSELALAHSQIPQPGEERDQATLSLTLQRLNLITSELREGVIKTRMQPIGSIWKKLPRVVRDLSSALGKQIELEGAGTEIDRTIVEAIKDPLTHLVRNSCDHGVELPAVRKAAGKPAHGRVRLRAYREGGVVHIEIADDGGGIDPRASSRRRLRRA